MVSFLFAQGSLGKDSSGRSRVDVVIDTASSFILSYIYNTTIIHCPSPLSLCHSFLLFSSSVWLNLSTTTPHLCM